MITDLIPQRAPIVMVDNAYKIGEQSVKTSLYVQSTNWFHKDGFLLEAGIVEHMAQSAAAMVGLQTEGNPKEGYIGDIKNFQINRLPQVGETIESIVSIITQLDNITLVEAVSAINGLKIAQARIKVFIAE